jgi:hypothetical protein
MEVINNLDQEPSENLKKQEFQVYTRKKRMNQPLSTRPTTSQPIPPPMNILLPNNSPKYDNIDLNFDLEGTMEKMLVTIPLRGVIKVPSVKERFKIVSMYHMSQWTLLLCCKQTFLGFSMMDTHPSS